ncbi:alpha/beta hydrolase [Candidatus Roizmanbacteria bacterium]|nr:alpha/beta hydrolase [Candidatus Roizmanbacteria bacterium]
MTNLKIKNFFGENLDVWIEGEEKSNTSIIFIHGLSANKHYDYFDTAVKELGSTHRIIRFDFSGCGESEGKLEEKDIKKWSDDLRIIVDFVKEKYKGNIYFVAQSMGCFVAVLANTRGIEKTILTGIPNSNTGFIVDFIGRRLSNRPGGKLDYEGISIFPRSSGMVQKIGPSFWKVLKEFSPVEKLRDFSKKTKLLIVHAKKDEIVGDQFLKEYSVIPGIEIIWLDGDHSFSDLENRKNLILKIKAFFK